MKRVNILAIGIFVLALAACKSGGGACDGEVVGSWTGDAGDALNLSSSCKFTYTGADACKSKGTFADPAGSSGSMIVTVTSATSGACLAAGEYTCDFAIVGDEMGYDCGTGEMTYSRD